MATTGSIIASPEVNKLAGELEKTCSTGSAAGVGVAALKLILTCFEKAGASLDLDNQYVFRGAFAALDGRLAASRQLAWLDADEDGADVTLFYDHPIVRITASDIQLDTGGSRTKETLTAMNEALHAHTFRVSIKGEEWYVSDGKLRMVRLVDGIVITGAATEKREAPMMPAAAAPGPVRVVRPGGRGQRYTPY